MKNKKAGITCISIWEPIEEFFRGRRRIRKIAHSLRPIKTPGLKMSSLFSKS